ncbi:MAG: hypothetical protein ABIH66_06805, partial [bacterium]
MTEKSKAFANFILLSLFAFVLAVPMFPGWAKPAVAAAVAAAVAEDKEQASGISSFFSQMAESGKAAAEPEPSGPEEESAGEIPAPAAQETPEIEYIAESDKEETSVDELLERLRLVGAAQPLAQPAEPAEEMLPINDYAYAIPELDERAAGEPVAYDLNGCIASALESNKILKQKQTDLDKVDGQDLVDKSRFRPHLSLLGNVERKKGTVSKSFYPTHNPPTSISSAGGADL